MKTSLFDEDLNLIDSVSRELHYEYPQKGFVEMVKWTRPVITVRTSRDRGRSYDEALVVYDINLNKQDSCNMSMNDAWDEMARFSVGHPNLLNLGDGEILAYYYAGNHCDSTSIEFVRISI